MKATASALCIGTGGSVGREGPIVQIGAALGSTLGQLLEFPEARRRLLVACGAAAGISATFNAPIAGVFFAIELILADVDVDALGALLLASVTADIIGRGVFGSTPFLTLPGFDVRTPWEYGLCAGLGIVAAVVGVGFSRSLYALEDAADRLWHGPEALRPAVGGVALGALLLAVPQLYGVGYPVMRQAVEGRYVVWMLVALVAAKILATSLTMAIGGSGGVFAPSLFLGAALGSAYGAVASGLAPDIAGPAGAYGVVGMAAVFAAASRAPVTAVVIIFELTGDYRMVLPLMTAVAMAILLAGILDRESIYTLKLRRRGIDLGFASHNPALQVPVGDAMHAPPLPVKQSAGVATAAAQLAASGRGVLPVTDGSGRLLGVVSARGLEDTLETPSPGGDATAVQPVDALRADSTLEDAVRAFAFDDLEELPVVDSDGRLIGWLTHADVVRAYGSRLSGSHVNQRQQGAVRRASRIGSVRG